MASKSRQSKGRDGVLTGLDVAIQLLSVAKDACSVFPHAQIALGSACTLLTIIRDTMGNKRDFVDLGLFCAHVCDALNRGLGEFSTDELGKSVHEAIEQLTATIAEIKEKVDEKGKRNLFSRIVNVKSDKDAIAGWRQALAEILQVFNTELHIDTRVAVERCRRDVLTALGGQQDPSQASISSGELPPPAPKAFFGRDGLIEEIVGRAEKLESIALIGAGGIGKTAIALTVLDHKRIRERFGDNRRFIRCDEFPPSRADFLARLSKVIGAGVKTPKELASLRPFLSSKQMLIILDNAESILDPKGTDSKEMSKMVKELSDFSNICICITSRISNVPPHCKRLEIPTLTKEAARDVFYSIYGDGEWSSIIDDLLQRLDLHALSVTLLATVASDNKWSYDRLAKEWGERRSQFKTSYNDSLAATIELSLTSPTFRELDKNGNARHLLEVVAFYPHGVDEKNLKQFFPTILDRQNIFDKFCVLSLAYRNNGFVTMLAPLRDYLSPEVPESSPLLCATKDCYFTRLSVDLYPGRPGFAEAEWIKSEDVNVERLLDVFTSIDMIAPDIWDPCAKFLEHLRWHKPRLTVLRSKIEGLPEDHPFKSRCLFGLSQSFGPAGNQPEGIRLLTHALTLERKRGDDFRVALTLKYLAEAKVETGDEEEGMKQAGEALEIYKRLGDTAGQAECSYVLAHLLFHNDEPDAAEDAISKMIDSLTEKGQDFLLCRSHCVLGEVYAEKEENEEAIAQYKMALEIASHFNWWLELISIHAALAQLFLDEDEFDDASAHIERAKSNALDDAHTLGHMTKFQARIWYQQHRLEDARCEALRALEILERANCRKIKESRELLQDIEGAIKERPSESDSD
ncbi:hypothetical protein BJ322DRAFT_1108573 [Thelephora terrestris]|uniref:AAA+ ATPase domain-containing protein n=1 Tax=Thelephora terrestris TaxID=56493 RepID=A0A9P6L737_9AGAM|nr:hypothetical protein BJ322DRAFT_1108573 [Thelephora terrestris]